MNDWISKRTYLGPTICFAFPRKLQTHRDRVRREAMWFANRELDPDRVISVNETTSPNGPFSVTVWYRADDERVETAYMTQQDLKAPVGAFSRAIADAAEQAEIEEVVVSEA